MSLQTIKQLRIWKLANIKSAKKRIRQNEKRRVRNRVYRSSARTEVRKARTLIVAGDLEQAELSVREASAILDKAARKGILHPGNVSRRKGRLMKQFAAAQKSAEA